MLERIVWSFLVMIVKGLVKRLWAWFAQAEKVVPRLMELSRKRIGYSILG
jgi:hypothetical protein